jgi:hypothetical protein
MVLDASIGKAWYQSSSCEADASGFELHIFDPDDLGRVKAGTLAPYKVRPSSVRVLSELDRFGVRGLAKGRHGATYDSVSGKLFLQQYYATGNQNYIHQYGVR